MLNIVTYNVHSSVGIDRRFDPGRVARVLRRCEADVLALQEVGWHHRGERDFDQFAYFGEMLDMNVIEGPTKLHAHAHYGNAIITRLPIRRHRLVDLSAPLEIPRGAIIAELEGPYGVFTVINMHLGLTPLHRRWQLRRLSPHLRNLKPPLLIAGDFNSWKRTSRTHRFLSRLAPGHTMLPSFRAPHPRTPIDRVHMSEGWRLVREWRPEGRDTLLASDHLPVVATLASG